MWRDLFVPIVKFMQPVCSASVAPWEVVTEAEEGRNDSARNQIITLTVKESESPDKNEHSMLCLFW